ncbi:energy transducer TonB [Nereida sp. MMG025]|uniref:energy transducer TonB n=1 Tax=Nereida sp. MMG025 TaxID=2909981 RepID=UPI001F379B39|nr:energy transducer TonB [Nereida sp. MMG025]MCF6444980.1 energy transducer TonB [Nereida sp. MMG025]
MARLGYIVSGVGHASLIGFLLVGPIFTAEPLPFEDVEVSVISGEEFAALMAPSQAPSEVVAPPAPDVPEAPDAPPPAPPETPVETPDVAPAPAPDVPDEAPDVTEIAPLPQTEVTDTPPPTPAPPAVQDEQVTVVIDASKRPKARPAPRIAPEPVAAPPEDAQLADQTQEAVTDTDGGETLAEPQEATAPEEATTEVVTEAEEPGGAPTASMRPRTRPNRPAPAVADDAVADALAEALSGDGQEASEAPAAGGPPMSAGEKQSLVGQIQGKWAVPPRVVSDQISIVVTFEIGRDRKPISGTERLISGNGSAELNQIAYRAARSAIFRAGASGFDLPDDKFDQWKEVEITFNPSGMRLK